MDYTKLTNEARAKILDNTILQLEADHFRAHLARDMAATPDEVARAAEMVSGLEERINKLRALPAIPVDPEPVQPAIPTGPPGRP